MSFISGLKAFFTIAPKAATDVLDKDNGLLTQFGGWVNNLSLTEEEIIKANLKTVGDVQGFVKDTLSESTARSISRRSIASLWIKTQLALILFVCLAAPWDIALAKFYFEVATSVVMGAGTSAIIIFHFGSYGLVRHNQTKQGKSDD